ncbi:MAG: hypothetical protein HY268_34175 [Deltaproteobacteria bacterium]|nr:hypothetical protein [Deltaproteobacteria bacterium]
MKKKANDSKSKTPGKLTAKDFGALIAEMRGLIQSARHVPRIVQKPSAQLRSGEKRQKPSAKLALAEKSQKPSDQLALKEYQLYLPSKELLRQKLLDWTRDQRDGV